MHNELGDYQNAYKKAWDLWITVAAMFDRTRGSETTEESMLAQIEADAKEMEIELARVCASMEAGDGK